VGLEGRILEERVAQLEVDVVRIKATQVDQLQVSRQMLGTAKELVLELRRLVETLEDDR
jgi:hypothetical protein